jgi:hypothetical protein
MSPPTHPAGAKDRFEVYRFFNGLSAEGQEGLRKGYTPVPLVKTFLLEHVSSRDGVTAKTLEMTARRLIAMLPKGTCGNTFHRLVANVQRYLCPKTEVWLGAKPFQQLIDEVHRGVRRQGGQDARS